MLWKEIAKLELLSGSTRIALIEPNRFLNREEPNRRGTDTTRTALRFFFTFLKPNEPKRTAGSLLQRSGIKRSRLESPGLSHEKTTPFRAASEAFSFSSKVTGGFRFHQKMHQANLGIFPTLGARVFCGNEKCSIQLSLF